jgi:hypothetical protein
MAIFNHGVAGELFIKWTKLNMKDDCQILGGDFF